MRPKICLEAKIGLKLPECVGCPCNRLGSKSKWVTWNEYELNQDCYFWPPIHEGKCKQREEKKYE